MLHAFEFGAIGMGRGQRRYRPKIDKSVDLHLDCKNCRRGVRASGRGELVLLAYRTRATLGKNKRFSAASAAVDAVILEQLF